VALGLDSYRICAFPLTGDRTAHALPEHTLLVIAKSNIDTVEPATLRLLDTSNGVPCRDVVARGGRVYALCEGARVTSQARIEFGAIRTDTPLPIVIDVGPRNAFLSYLYTPPESRRRGAARALIGAICDDLAGERRFDHCVCHVQATNVRSLNAFAAAGFAPMATLWNTRRRLLRVSRNGRAPSLPLDIRMLAPAEGAVTAP
jgi:ribosomal protein S18 acetylase RimI-like enzyme